MMLLLFFFFRPGNCPLRQDVGSDQQPEYQQERGGQQQLRGERGTVPVDLRAGRAADRTAALDHWTGAVSADQVLAAHLKPLPVGCPAHLP
jgi:hypothetical protein